MIVRVAAPRTARMYPPPSPFCVLEKPIASVHRYITRLHQTLNLNAERPRPTTFNFVLGFFFPRTQSGPQIKGGALLCKKRTPDKKKNARTEMAQKGRKKAFKNIFLAHIQIPVKCFDLVSLYPGGIFWTTDITPSNFYSGTSTNGWGPRAPRRLPPLWVRTPARNMR